MVPTRRREFGRLADLPMQGSQYTVEACIMLDPSTPHNLFKGAIVGWGEFGKSCGCHRRQLIAVPTLTRKEMITMRYYI